MSDDITLLDAFQFTASLIGTITGGITTLFVFVESKPLRTLYWSVSLLALSWLVMPWIAYGIYATCRWNMNQINYIERPPVVESADQEHIKATHGVEK